MNKILLGGTAAVALVTGGALLAQAAPLAQHAPRAHKGMQGPELRTDVQGHVAKMFVRLDTNKDGFITDAEVKAVEASRNAKFAEHADQRAQRFDPSKIFARLDANKDGKITKTEADAVEAAQAKGGAAGKPHGAGGFFARLDTNKDSIITRAEFDAAATQMHSRMEQAGMHRGGFGEHMLGAADLNKDGKVTAAEMQQVALQHFDKADVNHDGKLTPDERKQSRPARGAARKA
jgi:Ca2+-binding EF-hand superfamily protein